jgi:hypothetical protein
MSLVTYDPQSLTDIIEESNLIVEGIFAGEFKEEILIRSADLAPPPPFIKRGIIFQVSAVLKNDTHTQIPVSIQVPEEGWRRSLSQHKAKHGSANDKSYVVKEYETEAPSFKAATILFLHYFQGIFELSTKGSYEIETIKGKLHPLLKQDQKKFK